jgi:hypothetical protein
MSANGSYIQKLLLTAEDRKGETLAELFYRLPEEQKEEV